MMVKGMLARKKEAIKFQADDAGELDTDNESNEDEAVEMDYVHDLWGMIVDWIGCVTCNSSF